MNKLIGFLLRLAAGKVLADSLAGVELIKGSGKYRVCYVNVEIGRTLSCQNFAAAMLAFSDL